MKAERLCLAVAALCIKGSYEGATERYSDTPQSICQGRQLNMFSRTFGILARSVPLRATTIPRSLPIHPIRTSQPSRIIQRFESNYPRGYNPNRRGKVRHTRWDPSQVQHARPLVNADRLFAGLRHRNTLWLFGFAGVGGVYFYYSHIEEAPVSGRRRFMCYSEESAEAEGGLLYQKIMRDAQNQGAIIPEWDSRSRMVRRVMSRLIAGGNLEHVNFEVNVIESDEMNAFVIPGGKVFVFTGMLKVANTDDALAAILGHEIAHNLARHSAESMSKMVLLAIPRWFFIFLDASGYTGGLGRILGEFALGYGIVMPASRTQESEADYIGLMLMAKSCYNPGAAVKVWQKIEKTQQAASQEIPQWLSTHPSNATRIKQLEEWMPKAEEAQAETGCATTIQYQDDFQQVLKSLWK